MDKLELNEQQLQLLEFVKKAHGDQVRKYTGEPYWTHPVAVAEIVHQYCSDEVGLVEIALCHDLLEDTEVTDRQLRDTLTDLGYSARETLFIAQGVEALTDAMTSETHSHFNRLTRKQYEAHRLGKIGARYQTVKYADLIHNTQSIVEHDRNFAATYLSEKRYILNLMRNGDLELFIKCYQTLIDSEAKIKKVSNG